MKHIIKRLLTRSGFSLQRLPPGVVTGTDLGRDLGIVVGSSAQPCCIDVGANHGDFVSLLVNRFSALAVHAFEPNPTSFAALQTKHRSTPGVRLNHAGLGDIPETLSLQLWENHALNSFLPLSDSGRISLDALDRPQTAHVPVLRFDDYAAENNLSTVDLLKIDTQGFELHVLRGAQRSFASGAIRAVLVELNFADLYVGQATPPEIIGFLQTHGLRLVDFYEKCRHGQVLGWTTALFTRAAPRTAA